MLTLSMHSVYVQLEKLFWFDFYVFDADEIVQYNANCVIGFSLHLSGGNVEPLVDCESGQRLSLPQKSVVKYVLEGSIGADGTRLSGGISRYFWLFLLTRAGDPWFVTLALDVLENPRHKKFGEERT